MPELPDGTVTFLFTDVAGSTALLKRHRDVFPELLETHQRLLRDAFESYSGREIDTQGDSFFVAFARAGDAVAAVADAQRAFATHAWPDGAHMLVRMGLHTSEPQVGDARYFGLGVHRAARICAVAHGGQVLLSNATRELVEDDLPRGVTVRDLGEHPLKDIDRPERLFQLDIRDLQQEFPPPVTGATPFGGREAELMRAIDAGAGARQTLPAAGLLEREDSLGHLESALQDATRGAGRLVFVAGEAGVGKTSLVDALCESVGPRRARTARLLRLSVHATPARPAGGRRRPDRRAACRVGRRRCTAAPDPQRTLRRAARASTRCCSWRTSTGPTRRRSTSSGSSHADSRGCAPCSS